MTTSAESAGPKPPVDVAYGRTVHRAMWDKRITQTDLAGALGIDQSTLSKKLRGLRPWTLLEAIQVADFLRVDVRDLLGDMWATPGAPAVARGEAGAKVGLTFPCLSDHGRDRTVVQGPWPQPAESVPAA